MEEDYYKVLGVDRAASASDIQKAYRKLATKYHPDVNPDQKAKQRFQQVQKAYDVLGDEKKRKGYDQFGPAFEQIEAAGGQGPFRSGRAGPGPDFGDIDFSQFFGGAAGAGGGAGFEEIFRQFGGAGGAAGGRGGARRGGHRGADVKHEVEIPFGTSVMGGEVRLALRRPGGKSESIDVKIPAGIADGKTIRLRGKGEPAPMPGDLLLTVRVAPHPYFSRRGDDLIARTPVTLAEAALGAKIDVPGPWGTISVKLPPGTSSGKRLRVKGHGVRREDDEPGDLYVEVSIVLPAELDETSLDLLRKFDEHNPQQPRRGVSW